MRAFIVFAAFAIVSTGPVAHGQILDPGNLIGGEYRPTGTYQKVVIAQINNRAVVDLSGLTVTDVEIGLVDGGSTLTVVAKGTVTFKDKIDGGSRVQVTADGDVTIEKKLDGPSSLSVRCGPMFLVKEKIDGPSRFNVTCGKFRVIEKICGPSAGVIDASVSVDVPEVCDSVSIEYKNKRR